MKTEFYFKNSNYIFLSLIAYILLGFYTERENFTQLIILVFSCFTFGFLLLKHEASEKKLFYSGLVFRLAFLFVIPFLSQDFYRFIWDGKMISLGISPYEIIPNQAINNEANFPLAQFLFNKMGSLSAQHYSNYPPINQVIFYLGNWFSENNVLGTVLFFKLIIILADIGIYQFSKKILVYFNLNSKNALFYFLNPLVIIELTGNLHFEGVMLFFLILSLWYIIKGKWFFGAFFIAISIATKLLPLLLLPLFVKYFGIKKSLKFYVTTLFFIALTFLPFVTQNLITNFSKTIGLWFVNFEFNASVYYIFRAIGYQLSGYNEIQTIGKILPLISILILLYLSFFRPNKNLNQVVFNSLLFLSLYFFLSTTIHPWYVINLLVLGVFTNKKYIYVWSFLVFLSYFTYSQINFKENYYLIFIEYSIVIGCFIFETRKSVPFNFEAKKKPITEL